MRFQLPTSRSILASYALLGYLFGAASFARGQGPVAHPEEVCSKENLKNSALVDGYLFRNYVNKEDQTTCMQVIRNGKVIFRRTNDNGGWFQVGQPANKRDHVPAIPNGTDITGHPNMIVAAYSGGAHCCLSHYVFELDPEFKLLGHLDADDTWPAYFADLDHDGRYYYIAEDWAFAYWLGSFGGSPNHEVILRWEGANNGGGFHLALDKMQKPAPTPAEWQQALDKIRGDLATEKTGYWSSLPEDLWQEVMDLIYTGHPDLAWKFLDDAGPKAQPGLRGFDLEDFCITLKESLYWQDLAPTLKDAPAKCLNAHPNPTKK